ncbi:MAG: hypothetical protein QOE57_473, partial [Acidimicrobiaceae bacterium]|nr:hypothetical protein [Acidimicrobiaceae bacterium]
MPVPPEPLGGNGGQLGRERGVRTAVSYPGWRGADRGPSIASTGTAPATFAVKGVRPR